MKKLSIPGACLAGLFLVTGCSSDHPRQSTLKPNAFYGSSGAASRPSPAASDAATAAAQPVSASNPRTTANGGSASAAAPATRRATVQSTGTYMIVGTVVAQANGVPIYADKVLGRIDAALQAPGRKSLPPDQFRAFAESEIRKQIDLEIREELEFAAAERFTTDEDQQLANALTIQWRQKEITRHGGSLAVTRDDYLHPADKSSQPIDFDDKLREQYRRHMILIYYQRRVWPRVQVSASDMREFYDRNQNDIFSEKAGVLFRVISIEVSRLIKKEAAMDRAREIYAKATAPGADFVELCRNFNTGMLSRNEGFLNPPQPKRDPDGNLYVVDNAGIQYLRDARGHLRDLSGNLVENEAAILKQITPVLEPVYVHKGELADSRLEEAALALNKGDISNPVMGDRDRFIYVIKCEDKRGGRVRQFEEADVQEYIRKRMEAEQRQQLRQKEQEKLLRNAIYSRDDKAIQLAIDMAMQKYFAWAAGQ